MRVNIYAEEMTRRIAVVEKTTEAGTFTGLRLYLELPVTINRGTAAEANVSGPFIHKPGDDDSSAITFWGKTDLREVLGLMLEALDRHYATRPPRA